MGILGEVHRLGVAAWAPSESLCGSWLAVAGLADPGARCRAQLEVYDVLGGAAAQRATTSVKSQDGSELRARGIFETSEGDGNDAFRSLGAAAGFAALRRVGGCELSIGVRQLAWGAAGRGAYSSKGLCAAGLDNGTVQLWDVEALEAPESNASTALVFGQSTQQQQQQQHHGPVTALDFNPFVPTLLASGGPENLVLIWDLNEPRTPAVHATASNETDATGAAPGVQTAALLGAPSQVGCLQWNNRVQHILAAGLGNGNTVIWDLKQQRPVLGFSDPTARTRVSALAWNPEVATQIAVASDDDRNDVVKVWDLRNVHAPLRELHGHQRGVTALSWCRQDPALVLSAGKDGRVLCWNPLVGTASVDADVVFELPLSANWSFALQWSPAIPGLFFTCDLGGLVTVFSTADRVMAGAGAQSYAGSRDQQLAPTDRLLRESFGNAVFEGQQYAGVDPAADGYQTSQLSVLNYAPKWMRPPCRAVFGFGAQLAYVVEQPPAGFVLQLEYALEDLGYVAEQAIRLVQPGYDLYQHCVERAERASSADDAQVWRTLAALFVYDSRRALVEVLCGPNLVPSTPQMLEANAHIVGLAASVPPLQLHRVAPVLTEAQVAEAEAAAAAAAAQGSVVDAASAAAAGVAAAQLQHLSPARAQTRDWTKAETAPVPAPWDASAPWEQTPHQDTGTESVLDAPSSGVAAATEHDTSAAWPASNESGWSTAGAGAGAASPEHANAAAEQTSLRALLIRGQLSTAAERCFEQGQEAEALLLASCAGPVTWTRTLSASIHRAGIQDATTKAILSSLVLGRFDELISHASDTDWRDLLALLLLQGTYADIVTGCTRLAERLHSHDTTAALVCALCAGDVPLATRLWMEAGFRGYELLERMLILRQALGFGAPSGAATAVPLAAEALQVVEQIATALVERGAVQLASAFLQELGVDGELTDRVKQFLGYAASGFDKQSRQPGASQRPVWTAAMQAAPHMSSAAKPPQLTFTSTTSGYPNANDALRSGTLSAAPAPAPAPGGVGASIRSGGTRPAANGYLPPATAPMTAPPVDTRARLPALATSAAATAATDLSSAHWKSSETHATWMKQLDAAPVQTAYERSAGVSSAAWLPNKHPPGTSASATWHTAGDTAGAEARQAVHAVAAGPPTLTSKALAGNTSQADRLNAVSSPATSASGSVDRAGDVSVLAVDVASMPAVPRQVALTLQRIYDECAKRAVSSIERKKIQDIDRKLGVLLTRLKRGEITGDALAKLHRLCQELEQHRLNEANVIHTELTREHYDGNSIWIMALKRLLEVAARVGIA